MGVVFQAEDPHLKRMVALKVLRPSLAASADFHRRFLREAQLAAAVDHEHLVTIYQVGEDRGVPFLAMKLLRGETLEDRLQRAGGRLPLAETLRVGREIAEGLAAAHAQGLIHRDVKPANIWLEAVGHVSNVPGGGTLETCPTGRVKIVDFGLARGSGPDAHFTQAGAVIGTPAYMAPEQANGAEVDARCDLFSLGVVLYRACTGVLPFGGKDTLSVLSALATHTPPPPHQLVPALPRACSALVMRLLAKDAGGRPQSAREVVEAIAALERGPAADPDEAPEAQGPRSKEDASPCAEVVGEPERAAAPSGVKRKGSKKRRQPASRSHQRGERRGVGAPGNHDRGRLVLVAALVLLGVAILVLLVALVQHATRARAASTPASPRVARLDGAGCPGPAAAALARLHPHGTRSGVPKRYLSPSFVMLAFHFLPSSVWYSTPSGVSLTVDRSICPCGKTTSPKRSLKYSTFVAGFGAGTGLLREQFIPETPATSTSSSTKRSRNFTVSSPKSGLEFGFCPF
jgi:serine/threonine protein kinase